MFCQQCNIIFSHEYYVINKIAEVTFMCAIAGIINFKKNLFTYEAYNRLLVRDLTQAFKNSGEWVGEHAAFSQVQQNDGEKEPIKRTVEGHEFVIAYNGELYNAAELKQELMKFGYLFTTDLDNEVILYSYIHYGEECCKKLKGRYSFCIWDSMRQQIYVCSDKSGTKPFFYAKCDDTVIFASEIKALFNYPNFTPKLDKNGLCEIFAFFPFKTAGVCIFKDVEELKPASYMIIKRSGIFKKQYCEIEQNICDHIINLKSRIKVLKPIIAETLDLEAYSKMHTIFHIPPKEYLCSPYSEQTTQEMLNEILEDNTSPLSVFVDRESALKTPELMWTLIKINDFFKEYNPIII